MSRKRCDLLNYYWIRPRLVDRVIKLSMDLRLIEVFDSIDIVQGEPSRVCGQMLYVSGPRRLVKLLANWSDEGLIPCRVKGVKS